MKWLFTFAVVGSGLKEPLEQSASSVIEGRLRVADVERRLSEALAGSLEEVAFYRAIMDDRAELHRELAFWVVARHPGIFTAWRMFVTYGVLAASLADAPELGAKMPSHREIVRAASASAGRSAIAFLDSFFEAASFARQTRGLMLVAARMMGATRRRSDY
jgi:hypothetical protein